MNNVQSLLDHISGNVYKYIILPIIGPRLTGALKCFSCKSLLDPSRECDEFSNRDPNQVGTCGSNEACLLYAWKKSSTETGKIQIITKFVYVKYIN